MAITLNGTTGITTPGLSADSPTLFVDSANDRVGIGTDNPTAKLDVVGSIRAVTSTTSATTVRIGNTGNNVFLGVESSTGGTNIIGSTAYAGTLSSNGPLQFSINNGASIQATINSSGNVGIGTTNPQYKLDVTSQLGCTYSGALRHLVNIDSNGGKSYWYNGTPTNTAYILGDSGNAYFAGNVGIGTDNPSDKLVIYNSNVGNPTGLTIRNTESTSAYSHARLRLESQNATAYGEIWADVANAGLRLGYNSSNTVKINSSGNIVFNSGSGIDFSATSDGSGTTTSELLDDYEEGTWTPTVQGVPSGNYITRQGSYTRIGRILIADFYVIINNSTAATSVYSLYGLPFTTSPVTSSATISYWYQIPTNVVSIVGYSFSSSQIDFYGATAASATSPVISVWGSASSSHGVQGTLVARVN